MIIARTPLSLPIGNGGGSHADVATLGSVDPLAQPGVRVTAPATDLAPRTRTPYLSHKLAWVG